MMEKSLERPAVSAEIAELRTSVRLGFWGLTLIVALSVLNIAWMALDPLGGWAATLMATLFGLLFVLMLVVSILAAYRLSRAHGDNLAVRLVYCVLMLLPIGNFIFLWGLKDRGNETRHELHLKELVQQSLVVGRPAPFLSELIAEAESKPEAKASFGRFARNTLLALGISSALSIGLLAVAFWASDEFDRVRAGILAIIPCVVAVAALIKTVSEALSTSPQNRSTPERAVEAYVSMVKQQRWPEAMSCLSWITGHGKDTVRPAIPELDLKPAAFCIRQPGDLGAYWSDLGGGRKLSGARSMSCKILGVDHTTETSATVRVRLSIDLDFATAELGGSAMKRAPAATLVFASNEALALGIVRVEKAVCFPWPAYQRNGQWYLLQVGFPSA
jgi:hypothetical protein